VMKNLLDKEFWGSILESYVYLGPLIGIGLPFLESFIPILPLIAIVTLNIYLFGVFWGFIFSYIGNVVGSFLVYIGFRYLMRNRQKKQFKKMKFLNEEKLVPLTILYCFPFAPSSIINATCGILKYNQNKFLFALIWGKLVMLVLLTYVGSTFSDFIRYKDYKSLIITVIILTFSYFFGKFVEKNFDV